MGHNLTKEHRHKWDVYYNSLYKEKENGYK